ncbi:hypothetical protein NTGBS_130034 [Candidatus Nitrotoga sp. BS]|nr:hypothetical protein NTGBS_130034 [Candidatus Nitrotoga sp. BS]
MVIKFAQHDDLFEEFAIISMLLKFRGALAVVCAAKWTATQGGTGHRSDRVYFLTGFHNGIKTRSTIVIHREKWYFLTGFHNGIKTRQDCILQSHPLYFLTGFHNGIKTFEYSTLAVVKTVFSDRISQRD